MKKIISFEKKLDFPSMIGEVTSIALDHNLKFVNESNVEGEFTIRGTYKLTEASRLEEQFNFKVPADIILGEKLDLSSATIEIDDFYYEIEDDDRMACYIDVKVEGDEKVEEAEIEEIKQEEEKEIEIPAAKTEVREILEEEEKKEVEDVKEIVDDETRECDGEKQEEELPKKNLEETEREEMEEEQSIVVKEKESATMGSLFSSLKDSEETFSTYSVYILRQEETISSLIEKYQTTKEALEDYNDLSNLTVGSKIIVPTIHNES